MVHKIVATAFHGEQPSPSHVVDHIDTNRRNNRAENLRWVTRFENIAANDKTLRRIEHKWGSVEGMLQDPDRRMRADPLSARSWMPQNSEVIQLDPVDTASYTLSAVQRNWRTPCAFPHCPDKISKQPLHDYLSELKKGSIFSHNRFGESEVETAILSDDGSFLSVLTKIPSEVKGWGLAKVTVESERFVHEACGTFFTFDGAAKIQFSWVGKHWAKKATIDDFC
ncbi:MAG: HNH endonuclease [Bdellovibrionaceae bacterium]|nr:HNH endonuclease [Pseudobdellovibrionaceae bacterium]